MEQLQALTGVPLIYFFEMMIGMMVMTEFGGKIKKLLTMAILSGEMTLKMKISLLTSLSHLNLA